jgi:hypothetical protein
VPLEGENLDQPLYANADITLKEALVAILAYVLSEGLPSTGLASLLKLLVLLLPIDSSLPDTKFLFEKVFSGSLGKHEYKLYCPVCENLVVGDDDNTTLCICTTCNENYQKKQLMDKGNFFIHLPLAPQLARLLQRDEIYSSLSYRFTRATANPDAIEDIYDGTMYRSLGNGLLMQNPNAISLTFSTDGLPLFSSSNYSIWPLQAIVNELPPKLRKENILLFGIWFGPQKPSMNTFLEPFVDEMRELYENGVPWQRHEEVVISKVIACSCPCDSVARCQVQNIKQFNGEFGCTWCLHPGIVMAKGNGSVRSYVYQDAIQNRTDENMRADAREACNSNESVNGVKGASSLMLLPEFDMVKGFVVDNLHCVDLGVTRQLTNMWLDSSNNEHNWYVGTRITEIDMKLAEVCPPDEVTRLPRSVTKRRYWKGSEWHHWLLEYSTAPPYVTSRGCSFT